MSDDPSSAAEFLVRVSRPEIADSADDRLRLYSAACVAAHRSVTPHAAAPEAGDVCQWIALFLAGAQDVWSAVRKVSISELAKLTAASSGGPHAEEWSRALFAELAEAWGRAALPWYAKEGLLRVYNESVRALCADLSAPQRQTVLLQVVFPALEEAQLPVREQAVALLGTLVTQNGGSAGGCGALAAERVMEKLRAIAGDGARCACDKEDASVIRVVEGYAMAAAKLSEQRVLRVGEDTACRELFLTHYAASPASSVRQYIAEALGAESDASFAAMLHAAIDDGDDACSHAASSPASWRRAETVLMALQQHLLRYLARGVGDALASSPVAEFPAVLSRTVAFAASMQFELARMGTQLVPLVLQYWVRYGGADSTAAAAAHVAAMLSREDGALVGGPVRAVVTELVAPLLWWFVAVRAATEAVSGAAPLRLGRRVVSAWRAALQDALAADEPLFAVRLALASFFSADCFEADDGDFYASVAAPQLLQESGWAAAVERPCLVWGIDFVWSPCATAAREVVLERLVPAWLALLPGRMTHQQCILLAMARGAVEAALPAAVHRRFSFVFHPNAYAAPATLDSGEEVPLGNQWLRASGVREDSLPAARLADRAASALPSCALHAVLHGGCRDLYLSRTAVEPVVLREARRLLLAVAVADRLCSGDVVELVVARLDAVLRAQWWLHASDDVTPAAPSAAGGGWDDDDDDDAEGLAVEGVSETEELREAAAMLRQLHTHGTVAPPPGNEARAEQVAYLMSIHS